MESLFSEQELKELESIKGEIRGVAVKAGLEFVLKDRGGKGLKKLETIVKSLGYPLTYKDIEVKVHVNDEGGFLLYSLTASSITDATSHHGHKTLDAAKKVIEERIDEFLACVPKTWEELAKALTKSLIWTDYEQCHVDTFVAKQLITSFLEGQKCITKS